MLEGSCTRVQDMKQYKNALAYKGSKTPPKCETEPYEHLNPHSLTCPEAVKKDLYSGNGTGKQTAASLPNNSTEKAVAAAQKKISFWQKVKDGEVAKHAAGLAAWLDHANWDSHEKQVRKSLKRSKKDRGSKHDAEIHEILNELKNEFKSVEAKLDTLLMRRN